MYDASVAKSLYTCEYRSLDLTSEHTYFRNHFPSRRRAYFRLAGQLSQLCAQSLHIFAYYPRTHEGNPLAGLTKRIRSKGMRDETGPGTSKGKGSGGHARNSALCAPKLCTLATATKALARVEALQLRGQ